MSRQSSTAAKIIRLCDEILKLGRKDGTVGDYQRDGGPCGGGGLLGSVWDERWVALAEQFDNLAEKISYLVLAIDPTYPVKRFYQADQEPYIAKVPGGRVRMPDHERESERDHTRWLYPGKTEAEIDALLAKFVSSMENLETYRARSMYSKPQWPGAVMLETDGKGKRHLNFMSWPKTVCQFEERFRAVKTWAETHLTDEAAEVPGTDGKAVGNRNALATLPAAPSGKAGGMVDKSVSARNRATKLRAVANAAEGFQAAYRAIRMTPDKDKATDSLRTATVGMLDAAAKCLKALHRCAETYGASAETEELIMWTRRWAAMPEAKRHDGVTWNNFATTFESAIEVKVGTGEPDPWIDTLHRWADEESLISGDRADTVVHEAEPEASLSKEARALAALTDHPDWSDKRIAAAADCNVKSLYRMKRFMDAKALLKEGKGEKPRGSKSKEGDVEAWNQDEDPDDGNSLDAQYK